MRRLASLLAAVALTGVGIAPSAAADPNALWTIVHDQCVPDQVRHGSPAPCADVDLPGGDAVLKDLVGATQFLLIPTARTSGIESPELLAPDAPNYFAEAWRARRFVEDAARASGATGNGPWQPLPRDWISLAINSAEARTQNQLHIHVDCVRADVRDAVARNVGALTTGWTPFPEPLVGDAYDATVVAAETLDGANPFQLVADGIPGARSTMGSRTIVAVGAYLADGTPGFVLLTGGAPGHGEDLQDHAVCPPPRSQWAK